MNQVIPFEMLAPCGGMIAPVRNVVERFDEPRFTRNSNNENRR